MFVRAGRNTAAVAWVAASALAIVAASITPVRAMSPHQKKPVKLTSTLRTEYRVTSSDNKPVGSETVEKKVFDNNTIAFTIDSALDYGPGVVMKQHVELTVEEESYFPRELHITKTVSQPDGTSFQHQIDLRMFANVAVVKSVLRGIPGGKTLVVPTGVAVEDLGVLGYLYQTLFWYDRETGGEQRFQWLDPVGVEVHTGSINMEREATIPVLKKKTKVTIFDIERERIGPARVWVDKDGTIVRGEQTMFTYELVGRKTS